MTNNQMTTNENVQIFEVNGETVKLSPSIIRKYLVRGNKEVTDQEIMMFLSLCKYQKLNPFLNEAYIVKFGNDAQIVTGKEAFMKRAEENPQYDGMRAGVIVQDKEKLVVEREGSFMLPDDTLIGGWAEIFRKDRSRPFVQKVSIGEYDKKQSTWNDKKMTMIRKTAIVQAMREAFPKDLGAMYTEDEVGIKEITVEEEVSQEIRTNANAEVFAPDEPEIIEPKQQEIFQADPAEARPPKEESDPF